MNARNGVSLAFLLVSVGVLLVVVPTKAEKSCDNTNTEGGFDGFLHKVKCGLKTGAKQVQDTANDGLDLIKKTFSSDEKPQEQSSVTTTEAYREPVRLADFPQKR